MNGSAFSSYAVIPRKFLVVSGDENLAGYQVTVPARKHFCSKCGTPIFNTNEKYPGACMIYLGTLDGSGSHLPSLNIFSESMLGWVDTIGSMARPVLMPPLPARWSVPGIDRMSGAVLRLKAMARSC
jgi:hypothetical protein